VKKIRVKSGIIHTKKSILKQLLHDEKGELLLEYGLLIALAIIMFITIILTVDEIYGWLENNLKQVTDRFNLNKI
jgi:Flp pilus assembly pilin Flp